MGSNLLKMKKDTTATPAENATPIKPATPPTTNPPAQGIEEPVTPEMLANIDRHIVAIIARIASLEARVQALEGLVTESDVLTPSAYQAIVINESLNMFPVRTTDTNGDYHTSAAEALEAAKAYIKAHNLGSNYVASIMPIW